MPRTKPKPNPEPAPVGPPAATTNGPPGQVGEVLTLAEAAAYLRFSEADVLRLVHEQGLPARRMANEWRFLKTAVQDWLRTGPAPLSNKEAWMALAGVWKDDPDLEKVLQEIHNQRERLRTEDES
jgi:excisionase family DNA binding protein